MKSKRIIRTKIWQKVVGIMLTVIMTATAFSLGNVKSVRAESGTCCPEEGPICVIGTQEHQDYYYAGIGPCPES